MQAFKEAIRVAASLEFPMPITLGGGEPTLHPLFWDMAEFASQNLPEGHVGIITNGHDPEQAFRVLEWHLAGRLDAKLSQDKFHAPISQEVVSAFRKHGLILESGGKLVKVGRALQNGIGDSVRHDGTPICICDEFFMPPSGEIFSCGCKLMSFGTDPSAWENAFESFFRTELYSCVSVSRWKSERLQRLMSKSKGTTLVRPEAVPR
nr:hypothetical protein [Pseudodesulfovibrio sp. SB368]